METSTPEPQHNPQQDLQLLEAKLLKAITADDYTPEQTARFVARIIVNHLAIQASLVDALHDCLEIVQFEYEADEEREDLTSWKRVIDKAEMVLQNTAATNALGAVKQS